MQVSVTASPTAAWIWRQLLAATPWGRQPTHLIHDRDAVYGRDIDARLARLDIIGVRTPFRSPRANAVGERVVRTFRAECLDHLIVINERHLRAVSGSSSVITTTNGRTGPWPSRRRSRGPSCRREGLFRDRFSVGSTTPMPERREFGYHFAALHRLRSSFRGTGAAFGTQARSSETQPATEVA